MKRHIYILICMMLGFSISAYSQQDARQRTVDTVVSDVLAAMPAKDAQSFESNLSDIAFFAPKSVQMLCGMLAPSDKGMDPRVAYAISGIVTYASQNDACKAAVAEGLSLAAAAQKDEVNRAFIESQLRLLGVPVPPRGLPAVKPMKASKVLKAMRSNVRSQRVQALRRAESYADDAFYSKLVSAKRTGEAEADIIYWLGERKAAGQIDFIIGALDGKYRKDAAQAAAKIGGNKAADALCGMLSDPDGAADAAAALMCFNGDFTSSLKAVADGASDSLLDAILSLASARHMTSMSSYAFSNGRYAALSGLVTGADAPTLAGLLDGAKGNVQALSDAYVKSISYLDDPASAVMKEMSSASHPERFYMALASTGKPEAVDYLADLYHKGSKPALDAIATMSGAKVASLLLEGAAVNESYIPRFVKVMSQTNANEFALCKAYSDAIALASSPVIKEDVLNAMSAVALPDMLSVVERYMDDPQTAHAAAFAAKSIMAKGELRIDASQLNRAAEKAIAVLAATGAADDKYAVDEIKSILSAHKVYPVSELTAEEKAMGFEMLYDGTGLDKWIGDKDGYRSVNGVINVTANWGLTSGNLYTAKEYSDFIYRFEFVFLEPGVNNGVGIRTPIGVDAAFDGMCECQILDHDDPIYAGLHDYQVHGSAYGIIPAKRIVHRPVGQWNQEEIEVRGTHVKVTLNGVVLIDGDLSEACQGHNVAPDGSSVNPYMVDKRNHPGMFNKKGHISFCGHGNGLQFRNVRILDLSK